MADASQEHRDSTGELRSDSSSAINANPERKKRDRRSSKSNPNLSLNNQVSVKDIPNLAERSSLNTEEPFQTRFNNQRSPSNFNALTNNSDAYNSQTPALPSINGFESKERQTQAQTSDQMTKGPNLDHYNDRQSSEVSHQQKSEISVAKVSPVVQQLPPSPGEKRTFIEDETPVKNSSKVVDKTERRPSAMAKKNFMRGRSTDSVRFSVKSEMPPGALNESASIDSDGNTPMMMSRKKTLARIQTRHMSKIKVQTNGYEQMDITSLRLYGLSDWRVLLIKKFLRKRLYGILMLVFTVLYAAVICATLISHDLMFEDRAKEYLANTWIDEEAPTELVHEILALSEFVILVIFGIDVLLHCVGYGLLYLRHTVSIIDSIFIIVNLGLLLHIGTSASRSNNLLGTKTLTAVTLLYLRIEPLRFKITKILRPDSSKKVHTEMQENELNSSMLLRSKTNIGVVSIRQKVIEELRQVQERVDHDLRADFALEYCIKMIANNQLNEQDFNFDESEKAQGVIGSPSDSQSSSSEKEDKSTIKVEMKNSMKAWYAQFAEKHRKGFKHNSTLYKNEQSYAMSMQTKFGTSLALKMIMRMLDLTPSAEKELQKINSYEFDIFALRKHTHGKELQTLLPYVLARQGLIGPCKLEFSSLMNFVRALSNGYKNITYHNQTHAADVCQTFNYFTIEGGMKNKLKLDNLEHMSCLISATLHDFEHPGVTSPFLVSMNDQMAVRHNDLSVLENHHLAASFQLMANESNCNWAAKMTREEFKRVRHVIIQTVLTTDMTKHFVELGHLSSRLQDDDFNPVESKDKELFIKFMFHLADISNPTKPWRLCRLWCDLLFVEFFAQGDLEKMHGFPVSQFFDRETTNIAKSQIGFINFIIKPAYSKVVEVFPMLYHTVENCEQNIEEWTKMFDEYESQLQAGNDQSNIIEHYLPRPNMLLQPNLFKHRSRGASIRKTIDKQELQQQRRGSNARDNGIKVDIQLDSKDEDLPDPLLS